MQEETSRGTSKAPKKEVSVMNPGRGPERGAAGAGALDAPKISDSPRQPAARKPSLRLIFQISMTDTVRQGASGQDTCGAVALAYSLNLREKLIEKFGTEKHRVQIAMTRKTTEGFLSLEQRAVFARNAGADVLVSIHFNSAPNISARGTETFVERTAAEASAGNPGANVNVNEDETLATELLNTTLGAVAASDAGANNRGVKRAGLGVTRDGACTTEIPEIIIRSEPV